MAKIEDARATFERNIEKQTGRSVATWAQVAMREGLARHGQMVAWLKDRHGLSHSHANHVAKHALGQAAEAAGVDPIALLFAAGKEGLRPLYDQLAAAALAFGPDVQIAPKKANVSVRRRRQFALLQPSTRTRLDLGLILRDRAPAGRLETSGSFNAMFSHRVRISAAADIDAAVLAWMKEAYDEAG